MERTSLRELAEELGVTVQLLARLAEGEDAFTAAQDEGFDYFSAGELADLVLP